MSNNPYYGRKKMEQTLDDLANVVDVFFEEGPEEVSVLVAKRRLERCLQILDSIPTPSKVTIREAADLVAADLKQNTGH